MTDKTEPGVSCQRCGKRPIAHELPALADPSVMLRLCDECYGAEMNDRMERAFRQFGVELETAFQETGSSLPGGMSGYDLVKSITEEHQRLVQTPEFRARVEPMRAAMQRFAEEVAAELPGGTNHPDFGDRLLAKMGPWMEKHRATDDEASA